MKHLLHMRDICVSYALHMEDENEVKNENKSPERDIYSLYYYI